jgi:hypothetical protein
MTAILDVAALFNVTTEKQHAENEHKTLEENHYYWPAEKPKFCSNPLLHRQ